jgi:hypothetical protein
MKRSRTIIALGAAAILLIGVSGNACFAETPANRGPSTALVPKRHKCPELLDLERVKYDPQTKTITSPDVQLSLEYRALEGWLQGYATALNFQAYTDGNVTKGAPTHQLIVWIFSYCHTHPSRGLVDAAMDLFTTPDGRQYDKKVGAEREYEAQRFDLRFFRPFRADFSIKKSSSFFPPLIAATSQRGFAPRPAQVSPDGLRYFGGTFLPLNVLPPPLITLAPPPTAMAPILSNCF